ncbi:2-hydroxyacid dehydrogenase [Pseudacidovorax intermedius]|uniref:2-hydroxyacid dehydrogenase n=1 Tax=Pseudacidovorax intermedius TaxID=433924 RepID=UPI00034DC593|nr:2-hydroxyacid dehydrogenase [Pseudacidovorax intermedius]
MTLDTRPCILQNGPLLPQLEQALAATYRLTLLQAQPDPAAFLAVEGAQFDGIACTARIGAPRALIDALPSLRVISNFGVGFETIDVERARERGIAVGYTPDVLNDCVADTAFGLVMDVARGFSAADRFTRRGDWLRGQFPLSRRVSGKRLGIVGLGRIGRVIARRAGGFDMEVRYHNRRPADDVPYGYEPTLEGLARWADFLVVASAGGPATRGLISAAVLDALGPQGFLVNVSRGTVVDQAALVQALQQGRIAGAGLDVFEQEPQVPEALFAMDNVVLLPHVASNTHETRQAMADLVMDNLASYFATGRVRVPVPGSA